MASLLLSTSLPVVLLKIPFATNKVKSFTPVLELLDTTWTYRVRELARCSAGTVICWGVVLKEIFHGLMSVDNGVSDTLSSN